MLLHDLAQTSKAIRETSARSQKVEALASILRRAKGAQEIAIAVAFLSGRLRQGRIGVGVAALRQSRPDHNAEAPNLTLREVDAAFGRIAASSGKGSNARKLQMLRELRSRATHSESEFLARLVFGELRQGALDGLMAEAVARAGDVPAADVRRAIMTEGDPGEVAVVALTKGPQALRRFAIQLLRPLRPMLAQPVDNLEDAFERLDGATLEYKLDGARIQVHKSSEEVRVFSRTLREVTAAVPEVVEVVRRLPARELILDGEVIALRGHGAPRPFQMTMRRFGRKSDVGKLRESLPLTPFFFDLLYLDGSSLIDEPHELRTRALQELARKWVVRQSYRPDSASASAFFEDALRSGHEGIMAKSPESSYEAGSRGFSWLKIKRVHTLDLVVLAAEWGSGRRRGWLSNIHLGARDSKGGGYVMLGKTFKGMTDEMLAWQTKRFLELEIGRDDSTVYVRPEIVAEVAFNDLQTSPHYPGGLALRFARVRRYRDDKTPAGADTIETVRALHSQMSGVSSAS